MKKISKKLSLNHETVRVLSAPELEQAAGGGHAVPTTTIMRHRVSVHERTATVVCRVTVGAAAVRCLTP
jgi:hypothetical protein